MASSTTRPVASTRASKVRILIEKPNSQMAAMVPISETGMAMPGTSVALRLPMNSQIVDTTIAIENPSVTSTWNTELRMNKA